MSRTIEVIPAKHYVNKVTGEKVSKFSTLAPPIENWMLVTCGWTWGITNHRGSYTEGLGRVPAKTVDEAIDIAHKLSEVNGYTVIEPETVS